MRPVLLELSVTPSVLGVLAAIALVLVGGWLLWQHRKGLQAEHWYNALGALGVVAVLLVLVARLGTLHINAYGAMLAIGFVSGTLLAIRLGSRRGIAPEHFLDLGLLVLLGAVLGARALYLLLTPGAGPFLNLSQIAAQGLGGLSFHGGLLGGVLVGGAYIAWKRLPVWRVVDACVPSIALGYAITRIGCFLNGCCYGKPAFHLPWAMDFPLSPDGPIAHVHPTQLYASLMGFTMCAVLLWLARGRSLGRAGRLAMIFLVLEGIERFVMEIYRAPSGEVAWLTMAQIASLLLIAGGIIGWFLLPNRPAIPENAATTHAQPTRTATR